MPDGPPEIEPLHIQSAPAFPFWKGALIAGVSGVAVLALVWSGLAAPLDAPGLALLRLPQHAPAWLREALRDLTALGSYTVLGLLVASATLVLAARGQRRLARLLLVSALGAMAFSTFAKIVIDRARPDVAEALALTFTRSFPSGHALLTSAILFSCTGLLAFSRREHSARRIEWGIVGVIVVLVGASRVALGVHWPSDVLGGWCFGLAWALMTLEMASRADGNRSA